MGLKVNLNSICSVLILLKRKPCASRACCHVNNLLFIYSLAFQQMIRKKTWLRHHLLVCSVGTYTSKCKPILVEHFFGSPSCIVFVTLVVTPLYISLITRTLAIWTPLVVFHKTLLRTTGYALSRSMKIMCRYFFIPLISLHQSL